MARRVPVDSSRVGGAIYLRLLAFLAAFVGLLIFVCRQYLLPAMGIWDKATPSQRAIMSAHARLLLAVLLFILLAGLVLTLRIGRRNYRRPPPKPTQYPDAWSESAKRIKVDPPDADE